MTSQKIKELVEYYEDKIIINFESYFSDLILEDFYDGGFEDRLEDELYYEEYFEAYENGIIDLLLLIKDEDSIEHQDFKKRLIKMKRIIDTKLSKIAPNLEMDKPLTSNKRKNQFLINTNIDKEKFIKIIHTQLYNNNLIDIVYEKFKTHFDKNWKNKIQWLGTELQLINLIFLLIKQNFLDQETHTFKHQLVVNHFITKSGDPFKSRQLSSVKSEKIDCIATDDIINIIVKEISTQF